jgi:hypothetical protein
MVKPPRLRMEKKERDVWRYSGEAATTATLPET